MADIVKQASPVAWLNINLKGQYKFELSEKLPYLEELMSSIEGYLPVQFRKSNTPLKPLSDRQFGRKCRFWTENPQYPYWYFNINTLFLIHYYFSKISSKIPSLQPCAILSSIWLKRKKPGYSSQR